MLNTSGHNIDPSGVDGTVTQDVGQLGNILFDSVESAGKKLPQIMGEHLAWLYTGSLAQFLHSGPNITTVQRFAGTSNEYRAGDNTVPLGVIQ